MGKYHQGKWKPINESKYQGDINNIVYRSSWERTFMEYLDSNTQVVTWRSEEDVVPYISPVDNRYHRYFVDFWMLLKGGRSILVEVKPHAETMPPKLPKSGRKTKRYINAIKVYAVNQAKWKSAMKWCADRGWEFMIITEKTLKRGKM